MDADIAVTADQMWHVDDELGRLGSEFWQNFLEVDYAAATALVDWPSELEKEILSFGTPVLSGLAKACGLPEGESRKALAKGLAAVAAEQAIVRVLLLLRTYLRNIRDDVEANVAEALAQEYNLQLQAAEWGTDYSLVCALEVFRRDRQALRLFLLANTAECTAYSPFQLQPSAKAGNFAAEITSEVIEKAITMVYRAQEQQRCRLVALRRKEDAVVAFINSEQRRERVKEYDRVYYGTEVETSVLEFHASLNTAKLAVSDQKEVELASAVAGLVLGAPVQYVPMASSALQGDLTPFVQDLVSNKLAYLRLREITLASVPTLFGASLTLKEGPAGNHIGRSLDLLRSHGVDVLAGYSGSLKLKVNFRLGEADQEHVFVIDLSPEGDGYRISYRNWAASRAKREAFSEMLQSRYGVEVFPSVS